MCEGSKLNIYSMKWDEHNKIHKVGDPRIERTKVLLINNK